MDSRHGVAGGLSGPHAGPGFTHPAAPKRIEVDADPPGDGGVVSDLTLARARELMDWLEAHGCRNLRVECADGKTFTVHYDGPAK